MKSSALIIRGHQGVGKSTLAGKISQDYGFCRLSKDDFYVPVMENTRDHKLSSRVAYMAIRAALQSNVESGVEFVVDAPFNGALGAPALMSDLHGWGFAAKSVLLVCSDRQDWGRRLQQRGDPSTPNHLLTSLEEIEAFRGTLEAEPFQGELILDTSPGAMSIDVLARRCVDHLRAEATSDAS